MIKLQLEHRVLYFAYIFIIKVKSIFKKQGGTIFGWNWYDYMINLKKIWRRLYIKR